MKASLKVYPYSLWELVSGEIPGVAELLWELFSGVPLFFQYSITDFGGSPIGLCPLGLRLGVRDREELWDSGSFIPVEVDSKGGDMWFTGLLQLSNVTWRGVANDMAFEAEPFTWLEYWFQCSEVLGLLHKGCELGSLVECRGSPDPILENALLRLSLHLEEWNEVSWTDVLTRVSAGEKVVEGSWFTIATFCKHKQRFQLILDWIYYWL
jgi:hypothetical protein